jgi:predicted ATPase
MARTAAAWAHAQRGDPQAGLDECAQALLELEATGWRINWTYFLGLLADTFRLAGRQDAALVTIQEALTEVRATGERYYEAELHRQRGELLAAEGADWGEVEAALTRAREVATAQGAVPFLRRAEHALVRLRR